MSVSVCLAEWNWNGVHFSIFFSRLCLVDLVLSCLVRLPRVSAGPLQAKAEVLWGFARKP